MSGPFKYCSQMEDVGLLDFLAPAVDPRITFTRASSRTYFDRNGVMQTAAVNEWPREYDPATGNCLGRSVWAGRTNLFLWSEDFSNAAWSKLGTTISTDTAAAPTGATTMDKLVEDSANAVHQVGRSISFTAGSAYAMSFFVKAAERSWVYLQYSSTSFTSTQRAWFNVSTGAVGTTTSGLLTRVRNCGNGVYRITIIATATVTAASTPLIGLASGDNITTYLGDGASGVHIWGAQIEAIGTAQNWHETPYIPTTTATVSRSADVVEVNTVASLGWNDNAGTMFIDALLRYEDDAQNNIVPWCWRRATLEYWQVIVNCATSRTGQVNSSMRGGTLETAQGDTSDYTPGLKRIRIATAFSVADNVIALAVDGELETPDIVPAVMPTMPPNLLRIGKGATESDLGFGGWIRRIRYYPYRVSDAVLTKLGK